MTANPNSGYTQCPKCGYKPPRPFAANAHCPACGIYFFKWEQKQASKAMPEPALAHKEDQPALGLIARFVLTPLHGLSPAIFSGRCMLFAALAVWSWYLFGYGYRDSQFNASVIHAVLLPIHESGHVLFRLFSADFMAIFGGSLFQVIFPVSIGIAFMVRNRDNFGAALGLWLTGVSFLDLAPYIYDALEPALVLVGERPGQAGGHDWIYLLTAFDALDKAHSWGAAAHASGGAIMLVSLAWAAAVLWRQRKALAKRAEPKHPLAR